MVLWVVHNEAWGQGTDTAQGADTAAVTAALHHLDPARLVTDASGWLLSVPTPRLPPPATTAFPLARPCGAGVDCGDVVDVHAYPGPWPSAAARHRWYPPQLWHALQWGRDPTRVSVLGEFGGFSYRKAGAAGGTADAGGDGGDAGGDGGDSGDSGDSGNSGEGGEGSDGEGGGWGYQATSSCAELVGNVTAAWRRVATARLSAAVYTQLSDIELERNGLLTYGRRLKCGRQLRRELPPLLEQIRSASNRDNGRLDGPEEAARLKAEAAAEMEAEAESNATLAKAAKAKAETCPDGKCGGVVIVIADQAHVLV